MQEPANPSPVTDPPVPRLPGAGAGRFQGLADTFSSVMLPVGLALVVLVAWEVIVRWAKFPEAILPPPSAIFDQLVQHHRLLLKHALPTTLETLLAFGISIPRYPARPSRMLKSQSS